MHPAETSGVPRYRLGEGAGRQGSLEDLDGALLRSRRSSSACSFTGGTRGRWCHLILRRDAVAARFCWALA